VAPGGADREGRYRSDTAGQEWGLPAIGLMGTWAAFGLCMVLFLAGMQGIPAELYDAARVDGAGPVREFFTVTLRACAARWRWC
jgi:ABC-type sugar transport system permease subunit